MLFLNDAAMMDLDPFSSDDLPLHIPQPPSSPLTMLAPPKALCELLFKRPQVGFDVLTKEGQADKPLTDITRGVTHGA